MEFTLVQEGITPLTAAQMTDIAQTLEVFFQESTVDDPIRFDEVVDACRHSDAGWTDFPRSPTTLEIMAACCNLESRGIIRTEFIDGILHFA